MSDDSPQPTADNIELRELGVEFARMIAALAVDPHGYFEKKYISRIEHAATDTEIRGVLAQLIQWTTSPALSDDNRATLDRKLAQLGLPSVAELRVQFLP